MSSGAGGAAVVYLLWTHGEDGPDNLEATLDAAVARAWVAAVDCFRDCGDLAREAIAVGKPGIWSLQFGWGGWHLQIAELAA